MLKTRYQLARYEDLPAARYDECLAFIRTQYHTLTGTDLELTTQQELR